MTNTLIYKIMPSCDWAHAQETGVYRGSEVDLRDGFIHFSAAHQVAGTAAKHFKGQTDLLLIAIDARTLGTALRWEASRGGDYFPHLYGDLNTSSAVWDVSLELDSSDIPIVPRDLDAC